MLLRRELTQRFYRYKHRRLWKSIKNWAGIQQNYRDTKKINKVGSYLINEKLADCQSVNLIELLLNISSDSSIADTSACINGLEKNSTPDGSLAIPIIETLLYKNQLDECLSSADYTLSQPSVLKLLKQNCKELYPQSVATKEFLFNEISFSKSEVVSKIIDGQNDGKLRKHKFTDKA